MMRTWRKTALFAVCSLLFAGLASASVSRREAAVRREINPKARIVIAREQLTAGKPIQAKQLALRTLPAHYLPLGTSENTNLFVGRRPAVDIAAGSDMTDQLFKQEEELTDNTPKLRTGERIVDLFVAGPGQTELVTPGVLVDVLVSRESQNGSGGVTKLVLRAAEVINARSAEAMVANERQNVTAGARFLVSLRVTLSQAIYLTNAQNFAREIRILPRLTQSHPRSSKKERR